MTRSLALLALATVALAADTTTISVFLPMADKQALVGSIIKADATITTLAFGCPEGTDSDDCGYSDSQTITQGASTWEYDYGHIASNTEFGKYTQNINCKLNQQKDDATCSISVSQEDPTMTMVTTTLASTTGIATYYVPVTITAGAEKLKDAAPGATATTDTGMTTATDSTATASTATESTATDATGSGPSTTDNAAWPMATHNALLAGAAALVGGIIAL